MDDNPRLLVIGAGVNGSAVAAVLAPVMSLAGLWVRITTTSLEGVRWQELL